MNFLKHYFLQCLLYIFLVIQPIFLAAQDNQFIFEKLSKELGLSQKSIKGIVQDNNGFMWFATEDGLYKFDGYQLKLFNHNPRDKSSLSDNFVWSILIDKNGTLWVGTGGGGLSKFNYKTDSFKHYQNDPANIKGSLSNNIVQAICEDSEGFLWIGTDGGGLNKFNPLTKEFIHYKNDPTNANSLSNNTIISIIQDRENMLWIGTGGGGLNKFDTKNEKFTKFIYNQKDEHSISSNYIGALLEDRDGNIWVGTGTDLDEGSGLNKLNKESNRFTRFMKNPYDSKSLSGNSVLSILQDNSGRIWIGTTDGLNIFSPSNPAEGFNKYFYKPTNPNSLSANSILSIFKDESNILWLGTIRGGINKCNLNPRKFAHYYYDPQDKENSLSDDIVRAIFQDHNGILWASTLSKRAEGGLTKFNFQEGTIKHYNNNKNGFPSNRIISIFEDSKNTLWFGTWNDGLIKFNPKTEKYVQFKHDPQNNESISDNSIQAIYEDQNGTLWIGTENGGLNKFNRETKKFKSFKHDPTNSSSLSHNSVQSNAIVEDVNGTLWIGTWNGLNKFNQDNENFERFLHDPENLNSLSKNQVLSIYADKNNKYLWLATHGGGLNRLDISTEQFKLYNVQDGLASNTIYCILGDQAGHLWLSTDNGLTKFDPVNKNFINYKDSDGLQSNQFFWGAGHAGKNGQLFFGGTNGFNSFNPSNISENLNIPPIVVTSFRVFDKPVNLDFDDNENKSINLKYYENFFSFEFSSLDYTSPGKNQYAYILKGFDKEWIYSGTRRYASYTNLEGGEYLFMVKGSNNDGIWNEKGTSIKIIITPPFWKTDWFIFSVTLLIIVLLVLFYRQRIISVNRRNEKLEKEVKQRTKEVVKGKKETDNILNNVEEGLFLINPDLSIGSQYSKSFKSILQHEKLAHENFIDVIKPYLPNESVSLAAEYIELMLDDKHDEESLVQLSPLSQVEFSFGEKSENKFLSFKFKRIKEETGKTEKLISTVKDTTSQVYLERQLKKSEAEQKKQMEWLFNILQIDTTMLREFLESVKRELDNIDQLLGIPQDKINIPEILQAIFRSMHLVKGNAALLDLNFFVKAAHEFEEIIGQMQKKNTTFSELKSLKNNNHKIHEILNELNNLIGKIDNLSHNLRPKRNYETDQFINSIKNMVENLSKDLNKEVTLEYKELNTKKIPYKYRIFVKETLIQFIRNSFAHGFELSSDREKIGKSVKGNIVINSKLNSDTFQLIYRDDGRGLNRNKLKQKAVEINATLKNEVGNWQDSKIFATIFQPGLSTSSSADHVSGRGVGMDIVKTKLDEYQGTIKVNSTDGQFCEFIIDLPLNIVKNPSKQKLVSKKR